MFRSMSRLVVTASFVLALVLSTVPAQAQPRDFGSNLASGASWLDMALSWVEGLLGGGDSEALQGIEASGKRIKTSRGNADMIGSCLDPLGGCVDNG